MMSFRNWGVLTLLRAYIVVALVIAAVLSPLAFSFMPVLLIIWYLYLWRWHAGITLKLLTDIYMFLAIVVLMEPFTGPFFSLVISLPVFLLIDLRLKEAAKSLTCRESKYVRGPTSVSVAITIILISTLALSLLLGSSSLLIASVALIIYFIVLGIIVWRRFPAEPVEVNQIQIRMLAGTKDTFDIKLTSRTSIGSRLFLNSSYNEAIVTPNELSLGKSGLTVRISLSPALSGPSIVKLKGQAIDRFGLIQTRFELEPINLYIIPRARYAVWLAEKYLAQTKPGSLSLLTDIRAVKTLYGLRQGVEYYGNRPYQPGDSLKNIDWKHSLRNREFITKEFAEFHGQPAVILINLAVGSAEEADKLAFNIIVTALSLARENIPSALAAYNHERVERTTAALEPRQLVLQSLFLARGIVTVKNPIKYLNPPDVARLRADINRLNLLESAASKTLLQLLEMEYMSLSDNARKSPATKALSEVFAKADKRSNVIVISCRNGDAEALAFDAFNLERKGNAVITV